MNTTTIFATIVLAVILVAGALRRLLAQGPGAVRGHYRTLFEELVSKLHAA